MDIREFSIVSWDGTRLSLYDTREGRVCAILCNGLGGDIRAWRPVLDRFEGTIRFISWDYRGLYKSEKSKDRRNYKLEHHAKDLEQILQFFEIKRAIFFGWSMGVQLCLEFYRMHPEVFEAMVLINGVAGKPFEKAFNGKVPFFMWDLFFCYMQSGLKVLFPLARILAKRSMILRMAAVLGLYTPSRYRDVARDLVISWLNLDMREYVRNFKGLGEHDAEDVLEKVRCPTLIVYGTRDLFTPSIFAVQMAQKIPGAELLEVENGSHYTPLEFPDKINDAIERFLKKYGLI